MNHFADTSRRAQTMLQAVAEVVFEIVCGVTGHGLLWAVTLGRWKAFERCNDLATVVGLLFWVAIGGGSVLVLDR